MPRYDYDLFVIGGGSGGVRAARVAAALGKRVAIAEEYRFGGTCVIRGCVPKKLFVYASQFPEHFEDAAGYGWTVPEASFDWPTLIANKDREIARLEGLYQSGVEKAGGETFHSRAVLVDAHTVRIESEDRTVTADQILIATGGRPNPHAALPGHEHCIFSNEAFDLPELPKAIVIAGGGYIAVEFANIFHGLGVETTLIYRGKEILRASTWTCGACCTRRWRRRASGSSATTIFERIEKRAGRPARRASSADGEVLAADQVMLAIGRIPNTENLGLEAAGVETGKLGEIIVDDYSRTNVDNIWAIGDVTNRVQLTPVAIHEAMCFVETAFKRQSDRARPRHDPDRGVLAAGDRHGRPVGGRCGQALRRARDLPRRVPADAPHACRPRRDSMLMKLVVDADTRLVLGAHILGPDAGEMAQLLGIAAQGAAHQGRFRPHHGACTRPRPRNW